MPSPAELDALPKSEAAEALARCCGSSRWVQRMLARRPFRTVQRLLVEAEEMWRALEPSDWLEAFAHHPRIGERRGALPQDEAGSAWSAKEQAPVTEAPEPIRRGLAEANRAYQARFGYIYIVCASGRTAEELLALARRRLANDPKTELYIAAEEQLKITLLRLQKLIAVSQ